MKYVEIIGILTVLVLIVAASGCTTQQNTSPKTYSANSVTFNYPGNWNEQNPNDLQSQLSGSKVLGVVGDSYNSFSILKLNIGDNEQLSTLSEWTSSYNTTMKNNGNAFVSEKSLTIDGVEAHQITFQRSGSYVTNDFFEKNGNGYYTIYSVPNNDQQNLELILNSLKVT
ncbi:MAG: hypothetical protein ACXVHO_05830 [Methanobacterium sp.]